MRLLSVNSLIAWFVLEKRDTVCKCMLQSVRIAAQLGKPPERFYTNASESTNNVLKLKVDRKPSSLPDFVSHVQEYASIHERNIQQAFFRRGDWQFAEPFSLFEDVSQKWNQKKHNSLVKKVIDASCSLFRHLPQKHFHMHPVRLLLQTAMILLLPYQEIQWQ